MALAKERHNPNNHELLHQPFSFFNNLIHHHDFEQLSSSGSDDKTTTGGPASVPINNKMAISRSSSSTHSSPNSTTNSSSPSFHVYQPSSNNNYHLQPSDEGHSLISFKPGFMQPTTTSSTRFQLRFEQNQEDQSYLGLDQLGDELNTGSISNVRLLESFNSIHTTITSGANINMYAGSFVTNPTTSTSTSTSIQEINHNGGEMDLFGWVNHQDPDHDTIEDLATQESNLHKRPHTGESMQANKKQCTSATKKAKPTSTQTQSNKDPQSIAAKNRRERISERLKVLQDLVPNGSKVDLVTMLEKAISYVKFLQLQVKVLATDEFWPVQGGKAPELSQVKEAIDAILSSSQTQRDRNSSSTVK